MHSILPTLHAVASRLYAINTIVFVILGYCFTIQWLQQKSSRRIWFYILIPFLLFIEAFSINPNTPPPPAPGHHDPAMLTLSHMSAAGQYSILFVALLALVGIIYGTQKLKGWAATKYYEAPPAEPHAEMLAERMAEAGIQAHAVKNEVGMADAWGTHRVIVSPSGVVTPLVLDDLIGAAPLQDIAKFYQVAAAYNPAADKHSLTTPEPVHTEPRLESDLELQ